jgi:hypothetical protein
VGVGANEALCAYEAFCAYEALFAELRLSASRSRELEFELARRDSRRASAPCQSEA